MVTERFLGGAWASVHGPAQAERLVPWLLDLGFRGLVAEPSPRPIDWAGVRRAMAELPASVAAVRADSPFELPRGEHGALASQHRGDRAAALRRVADAARLARSLGCARVIVDPGPARVPGEPGPEDLGDPGQGWTEDRAKAQLARRNACLDPALDALCRALFELTRQFEDVEFCLTASRHVLGLGEPAALAHVFDDLGGRSLGYWHDPALAARREQLLGTPQGLWLEAFGARMVGLTLADTADGTIYGPPGAGGVDYPLVAAYRRRFGRPVPAVVELDPAVEPPEIPGVHAFLSKFGL